MVFKRLDYICQDVLGRVDTDELTTAAAMEGAGRDEEGTRSAGEEKSTDRAHPREQGGSPRIERDVVKAPSRSRDGWTVRKPPKRTGATKAPASDAGISQG